MCDKKLNGDHSQSHHPEYTFCLKIKHLWNDATEHDRSQMSRFLVE